MKIRLTQLVIALSLAAAPALAAAESFASSASSAGSASLGSLSDSVKGSSKSSSGETKVAEGDYRVIEVAELVERPGVLQLRLQAADVAGEAGELWLTLPQKALAQRPLQVGDTVHAHKRPYGFEFARADGSKGRAPFFLVLAEDWKRQLDPQPVRL
ncbi:MAG: hypothetical protein JNJ42_02840 [Burkholderiaceae bacterium]|jgi:hypothetical protein|nr:hypothetical protein [Burkholderiaceae bacterium]